MRLFVALELPDAVRDELRPLVEPLRARLDARFTRPERWHLTLAFLGETPPEALPGITRALDEVATDATPLVLAVRGAGTFGGRVARVLWLGLEGDTEPAARLGRDLNARLGLQGREGLHLTLARARRDRHALRRAAHALAEARSSPFEARELVLMESRDGEYVPLHRAGLGG